MYTIENNNTAIIKTLKEQTTFNYFDLCITAIGSTPAQGLDMAGVTLRCTLMEKFHQKNKVAELDKEQLATLKEAIKTCRWRIVHPDLVAFSNYIDSIEPTK